MGPIYSSPFVHTVYYSRDLFDPKKTDKTEQIQELFAEVLNNTQPAPDFAFNEQVHCASHANGTFMRLNGCSLLKLRHFCLHPTESTAKKIAQYFARFLSPLAAAVDLVINAVLLVFKGIAWVFMRISYRNNQDDIEALYLNVTWQGAMVIDSLGDLFVTIIALPLNLAGPKIASGHDDMTRWAYKVYQYQEYETFPPPAFYNQNNNKPWYNEGTPTVILDPQRVRYLQSHCGWGDVSIEHMKNMINFQRFRDTDVAFSHNSDGSINLALRYEITKTIGNLRYTQPGVLEINPRLHRPPQPIPIQPVYMGQPVPTSVVYMGQHVPSAPFLQEEGKG